MSDRDSKTSTPDVMVPLTKGPYDKETSAERMRATRVAAQSKTLGVTEYAEAEKRISDVQHIGDGDQWQLLSKAWSDAEGWMKSTKAMYIDRAGCLVQVTTQQGDMVAEAVTFVVGVKIVDDVNGGRKLVRIAN